MKKFTCMLFLLVSLHAVAQKTAEANQYYVVLYTIGESWDTTRQYHEQKYFNDHSTYLSKLRKNKTIALGARYSDTGMIVITAKNETEAREIVTKDIAIQNKLFKTEIFLFEPFYGGCIKEIK